MQYIQEKSTYFFFYILRKVEKSWRDEGVKRLKKRAEMVL